MFISLVVVTAALAAALAAVLLLLWWHQERIVFQPSGPPYPDVVGVERVRYGAEDGQQLFAFVVEAVGVEAPARPRRAVIAFHGNADLAAWRIPWATEVARRTGRLVVLPEYRGYGGLQGTPTVLGVRRDARAALRFTTDALAVEPAHVALHGHSLGSAVAAELAAEHAAEGDTALGGVRAPRLERLVLEAPFTSAREMARIVIARPIALVWGLISRVHYDTALCVRALDVPVWVVHGARDFIVPARMGERVFAAARIKGELLIVPGAGHNDVADQGGEAYWRWLERALR